MKAKGKREKGKGEKYSKPRLWPFYLFPFPFSLKEERGRSPCLLEYAYPT